MEAQRAMTGVSHGMVYDSRPDRARHKPRQKLHERMQEKRLVEWDGYARVSQGSLMFCRLRYSNIFGQCFAQRRAFRRLFSCRNLALSGLECNSH